jgi:hypothetical protein
MTRLPIVLALAGLLLAGSVVAQDAPPAADPLHKPFDEILDVYVRDGLVYYRALKQDRARIDRYTAALAAVPAEAEAAWPTERRLAFWINAYNAFVLQTVIDRYPIPRRSTEYPAGSIRQIPGAFERRVFVAAGRRSTLDQIEKDAIVPLGDARALLALGRGAVGGGRLRSEAYTADRLETQLDAMTREVVDRRELVFVDVSGGGLSVNPIFSWRDTSFVESFADKADTVFAQRSPIERAVLALIAPRLVPAEAEFLHQNRFRMAYHEFDWRLNDLTGR